MVNLTTVTLTAGVPTAGTGTVSTFDNIIGTAGTPSAQVQTVQGVTSMTPLKVDGSAVTQPVNSAQVAGTTTATGSGTMNAGTQRVAIATDSPGVIATGTAGSPSATVLTVQGVTSMTAIKTDASATTQPVSGTVSLTDISNAEYETVAASQTAQVLGTTGATGDYISGLLVIPATTSPGNVLLLDNATSITVFTGGTTSVSNLVPFFIPLGMKSVSGAWKVTTGTFVSAIGIGNFT